MDLEDKEQLPFDLGNALNPDWAKVAIQQPPSSLSGRVRSYLTEVLCLLGVAMFFPSRLFRPLLQSGRLKRQPEKVLIVRRGGIGDAVMLTPLARALKTNFPNVSVSVLVSRQAISLMVGNPFIDKVYEVPIGKKAWIDLIRKLRRQRFEIAFVLHRHFLVPLLTFCLRIPQRLGFRWKRHGFALTASIPFDVTRPQVAQLCELISLLKKPVPPAVLEIFVSEEDQESCLRNLKEKHYDPAKPLIGVHPGGGETLGFSQGYEKQTSSQRLHPPRRWLPKHFAQLADTLIKNEGVQLVILQGPGDESVIRKVIEHMAEKPFWIAPKMDLMKFAALLKTCSLIIANDSGPMHLARAVGVPILAIFGPTHPGYTGPTETHDQIAWVGAKCSPCFHPEEFAAVSSWSGGKVFWCWRGDNECMRALTPELVYATFRLQMDRIRNARDLIHVPVAEVREQQTRTSF
jgi:lipopolysaccharide heptosyltransferase II